MRMKFQSEEFFFCLEIIAARLIRKRKIEEKIRSFALRVDEAIWKAIVCQQGEAKRIIIIVVLLVLFGRLGVIMLVFVLYVIAFHKVYVAML